MTQPANKKIRQTKGKDIHDVLNIGNLTFNKASGGQKNMAVGPHLKPLIDDASIPSYTTNASTVRAVRKGAVLAIYNNSGTVGSVTLGADNTVGALAVGATDSDGNVGVACKTNDWTLISVYDKNFIITNSASLLVYIVEDDTYISDEAINR